MSAANSTGHARSRTPIRCRRKGGGRRDGPEPRRQGPSGLQASLPEQLWRRATGLDAHERQPPRHHSADPAARCRPSGPRSLRPAAQTTRSARRRPRLRLQELPAPTVGAWDQAHDRPPQDRARLGTWSRAPGRRTDLRLATPTPPTPRPLRATARYPRSVSRPRVLPHLLAPTPGLIVLGALGCAGRRHQARQLTRAWRAKGASGPRWRSWTRSWIGIRRE
jgi:hypothetical protein